MALTACLLILSACAFQQWEMNALANNLQSKGVLPTLHQLKSITPNSYDRAYYLLNLGYLKSVAGDIDGSIRDLQESKSIMASLQAISVSENLASLSINDTFSAYSGTPSERVLVHIMLAYNFLRQANLASARVEMLQADVTMQALVKVNSLSGQLASAHYVSGLIYELNNEFDDAIISYRLAAKIMGRRQQPIPIALQDSLLQLTQRQGFHQEYDKYVKRFSRTAKMLGANEQELIIIYAHGRVSTMSQQIMRVYSGKHKQFFSLALPFYPPLNSGVQPNTLSIAGQSIDTQIIEDIESLMRDDLAAQLPRITATGLLRAAVKFNTVNNAEKQGDFAHALMGIASLITETADTRSWNMLPSSIQIARGRLDQNVQLNNEHLVRYRGGKTLLFFSSNIK